jgi:CRP/FNR family cyclic AMP-dependent transcriptional regulator
MSLDVIPTNSDGADTKTFAAKSTIFTQGDSARHIYYLREGHIKLTVTSEEGKEAIVAIIGPGDFFGECAFNGRKSYFATARSVDATTITTIEANSMAGLLKSHKDVSEYFTHYLLRRTARLEDDLRDQLFNGIEKRLARLLLKLAEYGKESSKVVHPISLTHAELAEIIGTSRSRVTNFMIKFRKLGYISYDGFIEVHHSLLTSVLEE